MIYEIKKCINKKQIIWGVLFLILWGILLPGVLTAIYWKINIQAGYADKEAVIQCMEHVTVRDLKSVSRTAAELERTENMSLKEKGVSELLSPYLYESAAKKMKELGIAQSYYRYGSSTTVIEKLKEYGKPRSVLSVTSALKRGEDCLLQKQLQMLEEIGCPHSEYTRFLSYYEYFGNGAMIAVIVFLIFAFSNIGALEYSSKMNLILGSVPLGMNRVLIDKILSVFLVGSAAILFLNVSYFIIFFGAGYGGNLKIPLNCLSLDFVYCPYRISAAQYFACKLVMQLTAVLITAVITVFCSIRFRSSVIGIAFIGTITIGGCVPGLMGHGLDYSIIVRYSLAGLVMPRFVFKDYYAVIINGFVVTYPILYAFWILFVFLFFLWRLSAFVRKRDIGR